MNTDTARRSLALVFFSAVVAIASCATDRSAPTADATANQEPAGPALENTYWKLATLGGQPIASNKKDKREAHIQLHRADNRVTAFGGCNGMSGTYILEGDKLAFKDMLGTLMACADRMEQEKQFGGMLSRVARWRITDGKLELLDAGGETQAQFEPDPSRTKEE